MFSQEELNFVDSRYFNIITVDDYDVIIQSRNTGHYWYLHSTDVPGGMRRVSSSTNTNTAISITSTGVEIASDRLSEAYRVMTGGR